MTTVYQEHSLRYVEGVGLRPYDTGLDVVGGKRTVRLKGQDKSTTTLRLVHLLRKGHSLGDAAAQLDLPIDTVEARVALLVRLGVLTDAADRAVGAPPQIVRFLERTLGVDAAAAALDRLARSTVYVGGDGHVRRTMAEQLRDCGVGTIGDLAEMIDHVGETAAGTTESPVLVIDFRSSAPDSPGGAPRVDMPTLLVTAGPVDAVVGPLSNTPGGRCRNCQDMSGLLSSGIADPTSGQVAIAIAVAEAVRFLSGTGYCRTTGGAIRIHGRGKSQSFVPIARDAHCAWCGFDDVTLPVDSIQAYESFQVADVPLKPNWTRPLIPVDVPANASIRVLELPAREFDEDRLRRSGAFKVIADVFAPGSEHRRGHMPSVGGARLLNVFVGGVTEGKEFVYHLDWPGGAIHALPEDELLANEQARTSLFVAGHLTVVITATFGRAEFLLGSSANLTIYQDTGFAIGALHTALADNGLGLPRRSVPAVQPDEMMRLLGLAPGRDVVTAMLTIPVGPSPEGDLPSPPRSRRGGGRRPRVPGSPMSQGDLDAVAAVAPADLETYVQCRRMAELDDGLHQVTSGLAGPGLRGVPIACAAIQEALGDRGMDPDALVLFTTNIGRALAEQGAAGIVASVIDQAQAAYRVHHTARKRGLDAVLIADLPSTALAPDGRCWRTAYRSFAAVAIAPRGALGDTGESAVRW